MKASQADPTTASAQPAHAGVLICGLPRSGTSLVRSLTGSHPAFAVPRKEMTWWVTLYPRFRHRQDLQGWNHFLRDLVDAEKTRSLGLEEDALEGCLAKVPMGSHLRALDAVLTAYARRQDRPRWGEKTLLAEFYARDVLTALPGVKVIHLLRDPRDVFASYRHAAWRMAGSGLRARASASLRGHMGWTLSNWVASARSARTNAASFPERYFVLKYEDLVGDPDRVLKGVCAFLGEPFDPAMLEMKAYPDMLARGGNSSFGSLVGISTAPVGRYVGILKPRETALCEALVGRELIESGYRPSGVALPQVERLRLSGVDHPYAAVIRAVHAGFLKVSGIPRA